MRLGIRRADMSRPVTMIGVALDYVQLYPIAQRQSLTSDVLSSTTVCKTLPCFGPTLVREIVQGSEPASSPKITINLVWKLHRIQEDELSYEMRLLSLWRHASHSTCGPSGARLSGIGSFDDSPWWDVRRYAPQSSLLSTFSTAWKSYQTTSKKSPTFSISTTCSEGGLRRKSKLQDGRRKR